MRTGKKVSKKKKEKFTIYFPSHRVKTCLYVAKRLGTASRSLGSVRKISVTIRSERTCRPLLIVPEQQENEESRGNKEARRTENRTQQT
jgi:hypothetical protein